jgi:hypothetical protein
MALSEKEEVVIINDWLTGWAIGLATTSGDTHCTNAYIENPQVRISQGWK